MLGEQATIVKGKVGVVPPCQSRKRREASSCRTRCNGGRPKALSVPASCSPLRLVRSYRLPCLTGRLALRPISRPSLTTALPSASPRLRLSPVSACYRSPPPISACPRSTLPDLCLSPVYTLRSLPVPASRLSPVPTCLRSPLPDLCLSPISACP
jgi:hypothetical protein